MYGVKRIQILLWPRVKVFSKLNILYWIFLSVLYCFLYREGHHLLIQSYLRKGLILDSSCSNSSELWAPVMATPYLWFVFVVVTSEEMMRLSLFNHCLTTIKRYNFNIFHFTLAVLWYFLPYCIWRGKLSFVFFQRVAHVIYSPNDIMGKKFQCRKLKDIYWFHGI
jgi:hypothetical protein